MRRKGDFVAALEALRAGHEQGSRKPGWRYPSAQWIRQCRRLVELDRRLPAVLKGTDKPAGAAEQIEFAQMCALKQLHAATATFYLGAMTADPELAENVPAGVRYNSACAAALAGCGRGKDADKLDDEGRARWRTQAREWLLLDLKWWGTALDKASARNRAAIGVIMRQWQIHENLAGVRDEAALARLPEAEQQAWRKLWAGVEALRKRAAAVDPPRKEPDSPR